MYRDLMNVLMFVDRSTDGDGWPSAEAIDRFNNSKRTADDEVAGTVLAYRPGTVDDEASFLDVVAREFRLSKRRGVRLLLTGVRDAALADRLYRGRAVPVDVVFSAPEDGRGLFRTTAGVTSMYGWRPPADDADVVVSANCFVNALSDGYRTYGEQLRDIRTAATDDDAYASVSDAFGDGVRAVEPVLDAVLERLCGRQETAADGRWMSPSTVVEYGDRAAEDSLSLPRRLGDVTTAADYTERTTRTAASFAATFWHDYAGRRPTAVDRTLAECLIGNLKAAADLPDHFSDEHFAIALHAKFIGTRRWRRGAPSVGNASKPSRSSSFRPEIRQLCERFLGVDHLTDLMAAVGGGDDDDDVFGRSHVEHLERYVLPQRLVEYASRHFRYQVRYFALTDTLVFRFTDGERGELVERYHEHRLVGPKNLKEFHDELYRADNFTCSDDRDGGIDPDVLPSVVHDPNIFVYRDFGYAKLEDSTVDYVSANGATKIRVEVYRSHESCGDCVESANEELRHRTRIECDEFWVTVHSVITTAGGERVELVVGCADDTAVAVTRRPSDGGFDVFAVREAVDARDAQPALECYEEDAVVVATVADGTRIVANFGDLDEFVCEIYVSDGTRLRTRRVDPAVEYCPADDRVRETSGGVRDKYLVCRRDLSGYEFVDDDDDDDDDSRQSRCTAARTADGTSFVVRTLTASPLDGRTTAGLVDKALSDHLETLETLADRLLNAESGPDDRPPCPVVKAVPRNDT